MDMAGVDAEAYAREVVRADLAEAGDEDVFRKLRDDFLAHDIEMPDDEIRQKMAEAMAEARAQILEGT
jgi:hypothetical protein